MQADGGLSCLLLLLQNLTAPGCAAAGNAGTWPARLSLCCMSLCLNLARARITELAPYCNPAAAQGATLLLRQQGPGLPSWFCCKSAAAWAATIFKLAPCCSFDAATGARTASSVQSCSQGYVNPDSARVHRFMHTKPGPSSCQRSQSIGSKTVAPGLRTAQSNEPTALPADFHDAQAAARRGAQQHHISVREHAQLYFAAEGRPGQQQHNDAPTVVIHLQVGLLNGVGRSWHAIPRVGGQALGHVHTGVACCPFIQRPVVLQMATICRWLGARCRLLFAQQPQDIKHLWCVACTAEGCA